MLEDYLLYNINCRNNGFGFDRTSEKRANKEKVVLQKELSKR